MNIVSTIMSFLTPAIVNKIASSFGINNSLALKAISAIVPALLAGIFGKSSSEDGARALSDLVGKQDPGLLGNLGDLIGGSGQSALVNNGSNILGSLLGGSATNALTGAVGKFAGIDQTASSGLMGLLGSVVLGALGNEQKNRGLDAGGLANFLSDQKDTIARAMPAGFSDLLGGTGLLDSISGKLKNVAADTARSGPGTSYAAPQAPSFNWIPWAVGAAALLALFWVFSGSKDPAPVTSAPEAAKTEMKAAGGGANLIGEATSIISGLSTTLAGIKDEVSAEAALPGLNETATKLQAMKDLIATDTPEVRKAFADLMAATMPSLQPLIATAMTVPGAEAILKTPLDSITGSLAALAKG